MLSPHRRLALVILFLPLLTGCGGSTTGSVAKQWALAFRELQITPVFPMREDVQVGDIYYVPVDPADEQQVFAQKGFLPISMFVGSVKWNVTPQENRLSAYYQTRLSFPPTIAKPPADNGKDYPDIYPEPASPTDIYGSGDVHRLRLVGFPSFMAVTFSRGDLSALIPAEALSITAGISNLKNVTVSIPVAESYGVPISRLTDQIMDDKGHLLLDVVPGHVLADLPDTGANGALQGRLVVIYEVYYARAVDIGIEAQRIAGFGAALKAPIGGTATDASAGGAGAGPLQNPTIQAVDTMWKGLGAAAPGGSLRLMGYSGTYLALRRVFQQPLAIGYRGIRFRMIRDGHDIRLVVDPGGSGAYVPTNGPMDSVEPLIHTKPEKP